MVKSENYTKGLLVTDKGLELTGIPEMIRIEFDKAGIQLETFNDVKSNPTCENVYAGANIFKQSKSEFIIALGGGSPMDVGKAIKVLATHDGPLEQYDDTLGGGRLIKNNMLPVYAVPTTAGTGSEVGRSSVITIKKTNKKTIIFSPFMMPTIAVLDSELTFGLPPALTAATGVDAFVHNLEAYLVAGFHPFADGIALEGMTLSYRHLQKAVEDGQDITARGSMLMASAMGATAFQKGLGLVHSIAHALGVFYDIHHGLANAALLVPVMRYNIGDDKAKRRLDGIGKVFGLTDDADIIIDKIEDWLKIVNMPTDLKQFNIPEKDFSKIEEYALGDPTCPTNSRKVMPGDVVLLLSKIS